MKTLIIKSSRNLNEFQLSEQDDLSISKGSDHYLVTLKAKGFYVSAKVYAYEPSMRLVDFFDNLAINWRGWTGKKDWNSLEGELNISCESDLCGHILMTVTLRHGLEENWIAKMTLETDAGQLEEIALNIRHFFDGIFCNQK